MNKTTFQMLVCLGALVLLNASAHALTKPINVRDYNMSYNGVAGTGMLSYSTLYRDNQCAPNCTGGEGTGGHPAADIPCVSGTSVFAIASGTVVRATLDTRGFGYTVVIRHDAEDIPSLEPPQDVIFACYSHLSSFAEGISQDAIVTEGQIVAYSGNSGPSTLHLHFQIDRYRRLDTGEIVSTSNTSISSNTHPFLPSPYTPNQSDIAHELENYTINPMAFLQMGDYRPCYVPVGFVLNADYSGHPSWHTDGLSQQFRSRYDMFYSSEGTALGFPWHNPSSPSWVLYGEAVHKVADMWIQDFYGPHNGMVHPYSALIKRDQPSNSVCLLKEGFWDFWIHHAGWVSYGAPITDEYRDGNGIYRQQFNHDGQTRVFAWLNNHVDVQYLNGQSVTLNSVTFVNQSSSREADGVYSSGMPVTEFGVPIELPNGSSYNDFYVMVNNTQIPVGPFTVSGDMTIEVGTPFPQAEFVANTTSGNVPLNVQFTDLSTGNPTSWEWFFGDGSSSTTQNPSHTYTTARYYTVTLVAHNSAGSDTEQKSQYIAVRQDGVQVTELGYSQAGACSGLTLGWTTTGYMTTMRIALNRSYPQGQWETLAFTAPNNGSFAWLITGPPTQHARFRVTSNNDTTRWDVTDNDLEIIAPDIISPNGGEVLVAGNGTYHVTWDPAWQSSTPIRIELNRNYPDGQWEPIELLTPNDGETWWGVTGPATSQARVRIIGGEGSCINDWSDADITILAPELHLTNPAPDDTVLAGIPYNVTWATNNLPGDVRITLQYFSNFGGGGTQVLQECTPNDGSESCIIQIPWGYETPITASASIEIRSLYYPGIYTASDSDFHFTAPAISIEQPWSNTVWHVGQTHSVTWASWYADCPVMVELNRNYPIGSWEVLTPGVPNTGQFAWTVTSPISNNARVRIATTSYPLLTDTTEGDFVITDVVPPGVIWARTFGTASYDMAQSADETTDGGYVVAGRSILQGASDEDMWLLRMSNAGDTLWSRRYNGPPYNEAAFAVQQATDGGFILIGYWRGWPYFVKTDASGNMTWNRALRGECGMAWAGLQTEDGGYIAAGQSQGGHAELVRISATGDSLWTRFYGGGGQDVANAVLQTVSGDFVLAGTTASFGAGAEDMYVVKSNSTGDTIWTRTYGGASYDRAYGITQTNDGGYIIVGETNSFGNGTKLYVVRTNADGDTTWTRSYPSPIFRRGTCVRQLFDGNFLVGGNSLNIDMMLVKLNQNGDTLWTRTYGGQSDEGLNSILQTRNGDFLLTGYTSSFGAGYYDYYVVKATADIACMDWTPQSPIVVARIQGDSLRLDWSPVTLTAGDCPVIIGQYEVFGSANLSGPFQLLGRTTGTQTSFVEPISSSQESMRFYRVHAMCGEH
jgi:PKD repeat protein